VSRPEEHREDVVRRLLDRGLSPAALRAMLPTFDEVITRVVAERGDGTTDERSPGSSEPEPGPGGHRTSGSDGPAGC
jgi:hypothetical protein